VQLAQRAFERTKELAQANVQLEQTQFAMDHAGIGLHWVDASTGRFMFVNQVAARMLGYSVTEMLDLSVPDIDSNMTLAAFRAIGDSMRKLKSNRFDTLQKHRNGQLIPVSVSLYYVAASSDYPAHYISFIVDISARKQAEADLREAKEIAERIELMPEKKQDRKAVGFCKALKKFFAICCRIDQRRKSGRVTFQAAMRHIPRLQRVLDTLCRQPLAEEDAENLRQRLTDPKRDAPNLFTFLKVNGMPPTNNHAEQALRLPVIFRKICFGSRSLTGAQALAVNLSLLTTAKRQGRSPIELFQEILLHGDDTPLSMIYDPDCLPPLDSS